MLRTHLLVLSLLLIMTSTPLHAAKKKPSKKKETPTVTLSPEAEKEQARKTNTCLNCHFYVIDKPVRHSAALIACTNCHTSHEESAPFAHHLRKEINEQCLYCHTKEARQLPEGHIVAKHPVAGPKDPLNEDKPFTCISCHNPHASNIPKLIRHEQSGPICAVCHPY